MGAPNQNERLRDFVHTAIVSPQATLDSISWTLDDYPAPARPAVDQLRQAIQQFLHDLHDVAVGSASIDESSGGRSERLEAPVAHRFDILVEASAQAQQREREYHRREVVTPASNPVSPSVRDHSANARSRPTTAPPPPPPPLLLPLPPPPPSPPIEPSDSPSMAAPAEQIRSHWEEDVLLLYPTQAQYQNFSSLLRCARELGAEKVGAFKVVLPEEVSQDLTVVDNDDHPVSVFAAQKKMDGVYQLSREARRASIQIRPDASEITTAQALERFEAALEDGSGLAGVVYCTDHDAKTAYDRHELGLPEHSPIWPLTDNELDRTVKYVPGLHHPFGYKSGACFGAPFALHKEDCGLVSLNVLYFGSKVWTVVAPQHASLVEQQHRSIWAHRHTCAQSLRHCSTWILPRTLTDWGVSPVTLRQRPNEVVVVLAGAYHQGFCLGSTLGEAVNYAPAGWSITGYAGCSVRCPGHPIPNAYMEFRPPDQPQQGPDETDIERDEVSHHDPEDEDELSSGGETATSSFRRRTKPITDINASPNSSRKVSAATTKQKRTSSSAWRDSKRARMDVPKDAPLSLAKGEPIEVQQPDRITTMAQAVGSPSAFTVLKHVLAALPPHQQSPPHDLTVDDPKMLIRVVDGAETSGALNCYLRRFVLARLAEVYNRTCQQNGRKFAVVRKMDKAAAYETMIQRTWGCTFPDEHRGTPKTKGGLIDAETPAAARWNRYKSTMLRRLQAGQRWLGLVEQQGWAVLALIAPDWDTTDSRLSVTDHVFEEKLAKSDYELLVRKIVTQRRRQLQDIRKTGSSVLDVLIDPSRIENRALLQGIDDGSTESDEQGVVQLLQSVK
ncbi:hypothetical protein OHC33_011035 [Knufia fluminis]|uniref:JmjC domain-containing protein n=1 Tax=Knufia fluminis TaxID=191047 RepID=A0AAN8I348_9EURO|nr:hypothetical protein OHC33_011035 [Knufia fluminis]